MVKALVAQVPVPLLSEASTILSINQSFPSLVFKISIVVFNKKLSSLSCFQELSIAAISEGFFPAALAKLYISASNCISAYSIPLCTILTKWPVPPSPIYVEQAWLFLSFAAIQFK